MHSYDDTRHVWRYDMGGCAWANTELMPDLWLWYSFLRTGRADIFAMAEAMTRHTQEVDVYHTGPMAGLGTRHNVRHWGCGAKEARIAQAQLKRIMYYLTTDERNGRPDDRSRRRRLSARLHGRPAAQDRAALSVSLPTRGSARTGSPFAATGSPPGNGPKTRTTGTRS